MDTAHTAPRTADVADVLAAGRPFPVRDFRVKLNHATASAHLAAVRAFWLDAARGYGEQLEAGIADAAHDVRECLLIVRHFTPAAA
jgi:hypothetical protein